MTPQIEQLEARLAELRSEQAAIAGTMTKEDLARSVDEWLATARARAADSSRLVLGGQASGEHLAAVLQEDRLDDDKLAARIVSRLERQSFGELTDRTKASKLKALDEKITAATSELREARKQAALAEVEAEFAGEAA
jgi:hypothetical protein